MDKAVRQIRTAVSDSRFLLTDAGAPGLGPRDAREGDVIAVIVGGRVPYVLRRSSNTREEYPNLFAFVGECYIHGVMHGQLFDKPNPPDFERIWLA